jgi:hypothetical protein
MKTTVERQMPGMRVQLQATALGYASALLVVSTFKQRMAAHGWAVDAPRLLQDSAYVAEQVALGHTSACAKLRAAALRVFALHHG